MKYPIKFLEHLDFLRSNFATRVSLVYLSAKAAKWSELPAKMFEVPAQADLPLAAPLQGLALPEATCQDQV